MAGARMIEDENGNLVEEKDESQVTLEQDIDPNTPCGQSRKKKQVTDENFVSNTN